MAEKERKDFCIACRKETEYYLQKMPVTKTIREKEYMFYITTAICSECGEEMSLPGLLDQNVKEIDHQYREMEGIVTIDDIEKLMKIYKIGKAPLSLALGFGEVTITRYLDGQIPSKEYSEIIRKALTSPAFMKKMLDTNRDKIAVTAYNKAMQAADEVMNLFSVSEKMLRAISYLFRELEEVTPLMLQKLLYFIQGIHLAFYGTSVFPEDCEAWVHGPVYREVYDLFRDFKYNPIEDVRFSVLNGTNVELSTDEKRVMDLVINTFGMYGGKVLERITHNEEPWTKARRGYGDGIYSDERITKESIQQYFKRMDEEYDFKTEKGINNYIDHMIEMPA
ncbi:MAG: DUF4065 domain-containing protein [Roseburia hominis]|nr:DUF4065 domain-containing protein [Roseburia hominis]